MEAADEDGKKRTSNSFWCFFFGVGGTWRIIPGLVWLIAMLSKSPDWGYSLSKSPKRPKKWGLLNTYWLGWFSKWGGVEVESFVWGCFLFLRWSWWYFFVGNTWLVRTSFDRLKMDDFVGLFLYPYWIIMKLAWIGWKTLCFFWRAERGQVDIIYTIIHIIHILTDISIHHIHKKVSGIGLIIMVITYFESCCLFFSPTDRHFRDSGPHHFQGALTYVWMKVAPPTRYPNLN